MTSPTHDAPNLDHAWKRVAAKLAFVLVRQSQPELTQAETEEQAALLLRGALEQEVGPHA